MNVKRVARSFVGLAIIAVGTSFSDDAAAVRYQRVSAQQGHGQEVCFQGAGGYVHRYDVSGGCSGQKSWEMNVPTEWRSGTQSMNVWINTPPNIPYTGGLYRAYATSYYDNGTSYSVAYFNVDYPLDKDSEYNVSISVPQDGFVNVTAVTNAYTEGVASIAWEYLY